MKSFLLIGQSNMAGRGEFGEVPEIINEKCYMLRNGKWIPMREPINPDRASFDYFHSGVNATSDRIVDFAVALAGDDPEKLEEMRAAFQKGFDQAAKTWGGELPDISQRTYDAVMEKFDKLTGKAEETTATN